MVSPIVEESYYSNADGSYIWGDLTVGPLAAGQAYRRIFDFGCGCGREARRLLLQNTPPQSYLGLDVSRIMIDWCQKNLSSPTVQFVHHDVYNVTYAPDNARNRYLPISDLGNDFSLIEANSVFTHLHEDQARFYLSEMAKMLSDTGIIRATWFFFSKRFFPMMLEHQNTIFVDEHDTTKAVFFDWNFFINMIRSLGFRIADIRWSDAPGFHNTICLARDPRFPDLSSVTPPGDSVLGF
jgi:SAM-dependent methyltransferase